MNTYKILLVGESGVGKTSFIKRQQNGSFESHYTPTVGRNITTIVQPTSSGQNMLLKFWDMAGQETLHKPQLYNDFHAIVALFDVTNKMTTKCIDDLLGEINRDTPLLVLGNKVDVPCKRARVKILDNFNTMYMDFSVKSCWNVPQSLDWLVEKVTIQR